MTPRGAIGDGPILPWRLVVGIFLHFAIPAYPIFLLAAFLLSPVPITDAEHGMRWLLRESALFLGVFVASTVFAGAVAATFDPILRALRRRRAARDPGQPAIASRLRAEAASARLAAADWGPAAPRMAIAIDCLAHEHWDHGDPDGQRLSRDLMEAADAFLPALASSRDEKRAELAALAAETVERIVAALHLQRETKSKLDEGDARTIARLIDLRYGDNRRPVSLDRPEDQE